MSETALSYRPLGRTGVQVTDICLGTMMFGWRTEEPEAIAMVDAALDAGVNFIDTANVYNEGKSETAIGKALAPSSKRDKVVLATKFWGVMGEDPNERGSSRRHLITQCEASLRRLGTDWIDLYQIHRPSSDIPIDETLRALDDLIRSGKVRSIGTSSFAAWQVVESLWVSKELGLNRVVSEQPPYNVLDRRIERELVPMAQTYGIAILPWSPLAQGFLTGKYRLGDAAPSGSRFEDPVIGESWANFRFTEANPGIYDDAAHDVLDVVEALAQEKGATPSQVALAWTTAQPGITSVIIGPRTTEQLLDNVSAAAVEITAEDCERLDAVAAPGRAVLPYWIADFGPHLHRW
ncbi:MAG: aldo/keto reductase [Actinomycetia bacterium]|nr:aldo/keto reductase [Actinomycetes bacterium]